MNHPVRKLAVALAAGAVLGVAACGDVATDPYARVAGPYILHSINGQLLPVVLLETDGGNFTVTTGALTLRRDRAFTETWTGRFDPPVGSPEFGAISASGTYELNGDEVTFNLPAAPGRGASTVIGEIRGDTLRYAADGLVVVYLD